MITQGARVLSVVTNECNAMINVQHVNSVLSCYYSLQPHLSEAIQYQIVGGLSSR